MRLRAWMVLIPLFASGCFSAEHSRGEPVPYGADCDQILEIGHVSRGEVLNLFGSPTDIVPTRDGDVFMYLHERRIKDGVDVSLDALWGIFTLNFFRSEAERFATENLTLFFDRRGILSDWAYTNSDGGGLQG